MFLHLTFFVEVGEVGGEEDEGVMGIEVGGGGDDGEEDEEEEVGGRKGEEDGDVGVVLRVSNRGLAHNTQVKNRVRNWKLIIVSDSVHSIRVNTQVKNRVRNWKLIIVSDSLRRNSALSLNLTLGAIYRRDMYKLGSKIFHQIDG